MNREIITALNARRANLGITISELAARVSKDVTTVKKQLSGEGNMQLTTLCEYATALNGRIDFISDDIEREINTPEISNLRQRLSELGNQVDRLKEKLEDKDNDIVQLQKRNAELEAQLMAATSAVSRKDEKLSKLIDSVLDLSRKIIEIR